MGKLEIGSDVYNRALNRMGNVRGEANGLVTVRSSAGLEIWNVSDCDLMTDEYDNDIEHEEHAPWK